MERLEEERIGVKDLFHDRDNSIFPFVPSMDTSMANGDRQQPPQRYEILSEAPNALEVGDHAWDQMISSVRFR